MARLFLQQGSYLNLEIVLEIELFLRVARHSPAIQPHLMRLLEHLPNGQFCVTEKFINDAIPRYDIFSHTWGSEEVTYKDMIENTGRTKSGYAKIKFCGKIFT